MSVVSGKDAYINGIPCITDWSASEAAAIARYAASCTGGGTGVTDGNIDWTGNANGLGHTPLLLPDGLDDVFKGVIDNTAPIALDGNILVNQVQINIPVAAGGPITWSAQWGAQGALTEGAVGAVDATNAEAFPAKAGSISIGATPTVVPDIQNITLTLTRPEQTYISAGVTKRLPGNLEADLSFDVLASNFENALYDVNVINTVRVYVTSTLYWELPIKFGEKSNLVVDNTSRSPVGYTVSGMWSSVVPITVSANGLGWIKDPAGIYFYGVVPT